MKLTPAHILAAFALAAALCSCGGKKEKVIPKSELAEIYAEMFVLDQWLEDNRSLRRDTDTSLVYAPVLEKYGYTYDDYLASVSFYMKDPTRYSRILRSTSEILGSRLAELKVEKAEREEALRKSRHLDSLRNLVRFDIDSLMHGMLRREPSDSLDARLDSTGVVMHFIRISDTVYAGPEIVVMTDSVAAAVADSTAAEVPHDGADVSADAGTGDAAASGQVVRNVEEQEKPRRLKLPARSGVKPLGDSDVPRFRSEPLETK